LADHNLRKLSRTALLLALTLVFQSLRFVVPIPPVGSTVLIGSLVNACLLVALQTVGLGSAFLIACVTPMAAYFQQLLPLPIFILPVAIGNCLYVWLFHRLWRIGPVWPAIGGASLGKAAFFYLAFSWILTFIKLPPPVTAGLLFVMSWPQLITGIVGGILAKWIGEKLQPVLRVGTKKSINKE
jgi:hypothetical protein